MRPNFWRPRLRLFPILNFLRPRLRLKKKHRYFETNNETFLNITSDSGCCWEFSPKSPSCKMDLSKFYVLSPFAKKKKLKFDQDSKACWSFCFELKVLNELKFSKPWVRCAFGSLSRPILRPNFFETAIETLYETKSFQSVTCVSYTNLLWPELRTPKVTEELKPIIPQPWVIFHRTSLKCSQKVIGQKLVHLLLAELLERGRWVTRIVEMIAVFYQKWNCQFRNKKDWSIHRVGIYTRERRPSG